MNGAHFYRTDAEGAPGGTSLRRQRDRVRITQGVYAAASIPQDEQLRAEAMRHVLPDGAALSHHTAARYWGGAVPHCDTVHVSVGEDVRRRRAGLSLHRRRCPPDVRVHRSVRLTSPQQTFLDLAVHLSLVDLVVLGDTLVRRGRFTPTELRTYLADRHDLGASLARAAASHVREGVDSPMETRVRLLLVLAGYPEPEVNRIIRGPAGEWTYRLDMCWSAWRLVIEYDGRQHAESASQWSSHIRRREALGNAGWRLLTVVGRDIYEDPAGLLDRVDLLIRERGGRPPRRSSRWRRHFPGRRG